MKELITPFFPNVSFSFDTLKKRKPKVLWYFQGGGEGGSKGDIGKKRVMNKNGCICTGYILS